MDGLPENFRAAAAAVSQGTLKSAIRCVGVGLHSGARVQLELLPAPAGTGIIFRRTDLGRDIPARFDHVVDTRLCTVLADPTDPGVRVATVEHLMAALCAAGIDNAVIALDGPEVPVLDGSSDPFLFLIDCAGREAQPAPRRALEVRKTIRVENGPAFAELRPGAYGLSLSVAIDFTAGAIGRQALSLNLTEAGFRAELANARTFTQVHEIEALRAAGLARGGSLANAVVVDGDRVLNPGGLRAPDEFVRHKMLDAVGDLALAGAMLVGRYVANRPGHALNNALLRALLADPAAWREVTDEAADLRLTLQPAA